MTTQTLPRTGMQSLMPILTIGLLFFIFGFVTWLNGALIPFLQMVCELSEMEALFIAFCFYVAYVVMALPMAKILEVTGYKKGMSLGLAMIAIGCLLFVPAALSKTFAVFLIAQFVVGSGLTILQTASNPFIVHLGSQDSAAARIAFMGLLNKFAGVLAPLLFTALVLGNFSDVSQVSLAQLPEAERAAQLNEMSSQLIQPYIGMAIALGILALGLMRVNLPNIQFESNDSNDSTQVSGVLQFPHLVLGAITLFCYVGVEVIAGDTIGLYGSSLGVANATSLTSFTMTAMVAGYFLGLFCIPRLISQSKAMLMSGILGVVFTVGIMLGSDQSHSISAILWGWTGIQTLPDTVALIALLGLANAMVWPTVWPLALADLGKFTPKGSAILIMGIAGGAILPLVYGGLSDTLDAQSAYAVMLPCYAFICYYALVGHKKRAW
ncbi:MAG TPA: glucose/galactose MFS transporter [Alteromonas sp.]|nr:glucose/galactose MFS transporter [Alteromonadaceae bacterium]MAX44309.1 glucose/galactose MFS transporter [Alteromonadaceae bacterium]HBY38497.1 glucose/galactose MFS transporter [Alteromonas sp.]|tara:strand:+ start:20544 stop:21857 length:1314 start_codon:yes stop_codon:yes gene_type:complete